MKFILPLWMLLAVPAFGDSWPLPKGGTLPHSEWLSNWSTSEGAQFDAGKIAHIPFSCARDPNLYPTHPQQDRKFYHVSRYAEYDTARVPGDDERLCKIPQKYFDKRHQNRPFCVRAYSAEQYVLSDTFQDACGHFYRGFWEKTFVTSDETMGTLSSLGRATWSNPDLSHKVEQPTIDGSTFPVPASKFLFFAPLFGKDHEAIQNDISQALQSGFRWNPQTLLFERK